jgi:23S rRNA (uracil1939-C5)-methyltransferase
VESLAAGGDGVARMPDGRALFVPLTAAGDLARIEVLEERESYARGRLVDLLEPATARNEPRCPLFGQCGGCSWQHLDYPAQLDAKATIVREALTRIAQLDALPELELVPSPQPYRYRGRARVLAESGQVGFRRHRSNRICEVSACPVLLQPVEDALAKLALDGSPSGEWEIFVGEDGRTRSVALGREPLRSDTSGLTLRVAGSHIRISPGVFAQSNFLLHDALYREVARAVGGDGKGFLLELYAGAGFFTLGLSAHFARIVAVESHPLAVEDLAHNLDVAGLTGGVEVVERAVEDHLAAADQSASPKPEVVLLDPPRTGLARGAAAELLALGAARVVYLSCDPATLARDLAELCRGGYQLVGLSVLDLFPQTHHVETLATLRLGK